MDSKITQKTWDILRATHHSWPMDIDEGSFYSGIVSIDPDETLEIWSRLSKPTMMLDVGFLPAILHHSLIKHLQRKANG